MILCSVAVALFCLCCVCDFAVASTALLLWCFVCFMLTALLLRCFGLESLVILRLFYCTSGIAWLSCSPWILDSHTSVYLSFPRQSYIHVLRWMLEVYTNPNAALATGCFGEPAYCSAHWQAEPPTLQQLRAALYVDFSFVFVVGVTGCIPFALAAQL